MVDSNYFIHTYNFVRYQKETAPKRKNPVATEETYTGYIDCSLSVKTPISIPDSEQSTEENGHKFYPFFTVAGKPIIPGSEIRGMIRNIYETLTNSCFSVINSNTISSRSITDDSVKRIPGVLVYNEEDNHWNLYQAERKAAYTQTTKTRLLASVKDRNYTERSWALSVQLAYNMQKLKREVDNAIKVADSYQNMLDILRKHHEPIVVVKLNDGAVGYIFKDKFDKAKTDLAIKLQAVNAEKKWGVQYSEQSLTEFFLLNGNERVQRFKWDYNEPIINFSVFLYNEDAPVIDGVSEKALENYKAILDFSEQYAEGNADTLRRIEAVRLNKDRIIPVFYHYRDNDKKLVLTPSHFSREIYNNTVESILGRKKKCTDKEQLCPGCRLFGMVGTANNAFASRVRFSDARVNGAYTLNPPPVTLKILASPKTTCWRFYADSAFDTTGVMLKGRKMYFHNPLAAKEPGVYSFSEKKKFNSSVQLMHSGSFSFRVYFDKAEEEDIKNLLLALTLGDNKPDGRYMHKIGHGKPLGLGSVKITVDGVTTRTADGREYKTSTQNIFTDYLNSIAEKNPLEKDKNSTIRDLLHICDFEFCRDYLVSYPVIEAMPGVRTAENDTASHRFFSSKNKQQTKYRNLPVIAETADAMKLPVLVTNGRDILEKESGAAQSTNNGQQRNTTQHSGNSFARQNNAGADGNAPICPICKKNTCGKNKYTGGYHKTCYYCSQKNK